MCDISQSTFLSKPPFLEGEQRWTGTIIISLNWISLL